MNTFVPTWFFGIALVFFVVVLGVATWRFPQKRSVRIVSFVFLHLFSLGFVLMFVFGQRQSERQFVEIGNYYSLNTLSDAGPAGMRIATLRLGNALSQPDYIVEQCKRAPCLEGHVDFFFDQGPPGPNLLTWEKSVDFVGKLKIIKPRSGRIGELADWLNVWPQTYDDAAKGVELPGSDNSLTVIWDPPPDADQVANATVHLATLRIELTPPDAPPRLTVAHPKPELVELPNERNLAGAGGGGLPRMIHLTASNQPVALLLPDQPGYIPTIQVGKTAPKVSVNAIIDRPSAAETQFDFMLNDGLRRSGNPLGARFYVGTENGILGTIISRGAAQWSRVAIACVILWLLPLLFFLLIIVPKDVQCNPWLLILLPALQMLIAVRLVLGFRAYFWEPFSRAAIESALFAALIIPLLVFIGCTARGLHDLGQARDDEGWRVSWWRYLFRGFAPLSYWLCTIVVLVLLQFLLRVSPQFVANADVLAFRDLSGLSTSLPILIVAPLLIWAVGLALDRRLRAGRDNLSAVGSSAVAQEWRRAGWFRRIVLSPLFIFRMIVSWFYRDCERDNYYVTGDDDPFTYSTLTTKTESRGNEESWSPLCWRALALAVIAAILLAGLFFVLKRSNFSQLLIGITAFVFAVTLRRFSLYSRKHTITISAAAGNLAIVAWAVSGLLVIKTIFSLLGFRTAPEAFLPGLSARTTAVFEILIVVLTIRVLAVFYQRWRDAATPFHSFELTVMFLTPMLMLMVSVVASRDTGALLVHGPAMLAAVVLITGSWLLWKRASSRIALLWAIACPVLLLLGYYAVISTTALTYVSSDPHGTTSHRVLLREGTEVALSHAETGGQPLIGAIEQNWRMLNYAAEGGWFGRGYGNAPVPRAASFRTISLDDLVFSVYLLSEHGAVGGIALLALYLAIFLIVLRMAWDAWRLEPLRIAFAGSLVLMLVFPAVYMAAANVNQLIFTGQNLPLLNLRSHTEILRVGVVVMLLMAVLRPLISESLAGRATVARTVQSWPKLLRPIPGLVWRLLHQGGRKLHVSRLDELGYDPWAASAVMASNLLLLVLLIAGFVLFPLVGITTAANNAHYEEDLDLKTLKERADEYIKNRQIWFEPIAAGMTPGAACVGGNEKNRRVFTADPRNAYQLCMDSNVKGGAEHDTFYFLIQGWNNRKDHRGNGSGSGENYDDRQFFQLDLDATQQSRSNPDNRDPSPLAVNEAIYHWASPFRPRIRWNGALTEANAITGNGGVLIGENLQLPLRAAPYDETPVLIGSTDPRPRVFLDEPSGYEPHRGFSVFEKKALKSATPIFEIDTISGGMGARLRPVSGDFDLYVNGCRVMAGPDCGKADDNYSQTARGTAPPIWLDDGDVIAYAVANYAGKRVPRHVFVYSHAQLGAFSHLAWANGNFDRFYPQGETWPMAQQITKAISNATAENSALSNKNIGLTINADLNHDIYGLLRRWRGCLDGSTPSERCCIGTSPTDKCRNGEAPLIQRLEIKPRSSRQMAVTLMDTNTGALLALAADSGTVYNPNDSDATGPDQGNINLTRHRIGSAIKPFTSSATLRVFPELYRLTLVDQRRNKSKLLGLPFDGKKELASHAAGPDGAIPWEVYLPRSDNLYAATFSLLGMCDPSGSTGLPHFGNTGDAQPPLRLVLTDSGTNLGAPVWAFDNMFEVGPTDNWRAIDLLDKTPLARQLEALFDVRTREPQVDSYANTMWLPITTPDVLARKNVFNHVSPEITNFDFPDITSYSDLRSVLLGGEFGDESLRPYGRVGSAWSNVFLAQSFARISTGKKVTAYIIAEPAADTSPAGIPEWFAGADSVEWRKALLHELEGVVVQGNGTAYRALNPTVRRIASDRPQYAIGSLQRVFTVVGKTGTLDPDGKGGALEDSNFVFTAGYWNDSTGRFENAVTGAIYIEQGNEGQAQAFAAALLTLIGRNARFNWEEH